MLLEGRVFVIAKQRSHVGREYRGLDKNHIGPYTNDLVYVNDLWQGSIAF